MDSTNGRVETEDRDLETVQQVLTPIVPKVPDEHDAQLAALKTTHQKRESRVRVLQANAYEVSERIRAMEQEKQDLETSIRLEVAVFMQEKQILEDLGALPKPKVMR